jgi:hypothetical protein
MNNTEYFFFVFLLAITISRFILSFPKRTKLRLGNFRIRHYMFAIVLIPLGLYIKNLTIYAFGLGLLADKLPLIPIKGLGYRDEQWKGCDDYFTAWCVAGVFICVCIVYLLRNYLVGFGL